MNTILTKRKIRIFLIIFVAALSYLFIAVVWASASINELLPNEVSQRESLPVSSEKIQILLKVEDPTFYKHHGLDISNGQGATTLTSSITADIFFRGKKLSGIKGILQQFYSGVFRCCKRIDFGRDVMALVVDRNISKDDQLKFFMSRVYMGTSGSRPIIGFEAASEAYYKKKLNDLSNMEFAGLVAMVKAPDYFNPITNRSAFDSRAEKVMAIFSGKCFPHGWFDTSYETCKP